MWKKDYASTIDFVEVEWNNKEFDVDINDLEPIEKNNYAIEAIKYWNYWITEY